MSSAYDAAYPNIAGELAAHPMFLAAYTDGSHAYSTAMITETHAGNVGVLANHERAIDQLLLGAPGGNQAANDAVAAVLTWGMPADGSCAIFYSVDISISPNQYPTIGAAFDQINAVHAGRFKAGVYGQGGLIDWLHDNGKTQVKGWLSASSSFPGFNPKSPNVGLVQLVGTDVPGTDKNLITDAASLGVWWANGVIPPTVEDDMSIEMIRSDPSATAEGGGVGTGAVVAHLGAGVLVAVKSPTFVTWINLARPVTNLPNGPWSDYCTMLADGHAASVAAIAAAVAAPATPVIDHAAIAAATTTAIRQSFADKPLNMTTTGAVS